MKLLWLVLFGLLAVYFGFLTTNDYPGGVWGRALFYASVAGGAALVAGALVGVLYFLHKES